MSLGPCGRIVTIVRPARSRGGSGARHHHVGPPVVTISSHVVQLEDGRILSWCELGVSSSPRVLVVNHGSGSSRFEMTFHDKLLEQLGLRVLAPERPGYGLSTALARGRSVADWPGDVAQLLHATGVDETAVAGYSAGGPHALALAASARLAARIRHVILLASLAPDRPAAVAVRRRRPRTGEAARMAGLRAVVPEWARADPESPRAV
jgi:pimeloyl-ACP methyl ester carboxylesterase